MGVMEKNRNSPLLASLNNPAEFTLTFELVPGRGGRSRELNRIINLARELAAGGRFQALSITENAGGHPALTPEVLGAEIQAMGPEAIIHISCKDKNRNQMESLLFGWDRQQIRNLLVIAGDYPKEGFRGYPKPVFDLDTVQALDLISAMNQGRSQNGPAPERAVDPTSFLKGVAVSPFKLLEAEQMMQYFKLHRKVAAGADFVITQLGYDARKFHELLLYMRLVGLTVPVLGNVFIPNMAVAELMYQGKIPGCVITEEFYRQMRQEAAGSSDKGKRARLRRAARLLAILKGLGYSGAHIGGPGLTIADLDSLLNEAAAIGQRWPACIPEISYWPPDAFYLFEKDPATGLNLEQHRQSGPPAGWGLAYAASRLVHDLAFSPAGALYRPAKKLCLALDETRLRKGLSHFEHVLKVALFGCVNCGDCTLAELAFLCPQSGCAKYLLNGACGGSREGWCEVYPGVKRCLYVLVYERLKGCGLEQTMKQGLVPPRDWSLNNTSSWVNFYRGGDHTATGGKIEIKSNSAK